MRRKEKEERALSDAQFVNRPLEWPRWPLLPMVSLTRKSWDDGYLGFMLAEERPPYRVFVGSFWSPLDKEEKPRTIGDLIKDRSSETYDTVEAMLKEWRID